MNNYLEIERKLQEFYSKYYKNKLLKGMLFFLGIGLLFFLFTTLLEHFFWFTTSIRSILFWLFILVELYLIYHFLLIPCSYLFKLRKGIDFLESSRIIGDFFPEVKDKLINILQLKENSDSSDLILASINQKSIELQTVSFVEAINYKVNYKYLKYALLPIIVSILFWISGNTSILTHSFKRVVNYEIAYSPPAPFRFIINTDNLEVVQGEDFQLLLKMSGDILPDEATIHYNNQSYFLEKVNLGQFSYTFNKVLESIDFYISANGFDSQYYKLSIVNAPRFLETKLKIDYPNHTSRKSQTITNLNNLTVPEGSSITWNVKTENTNQVSLTSKSKIVYFTKRTDGVFSHKETLMKSSIMTLSSSNENLTNYEVLPFSFNVVKDQFPHIKVFSKKDSLLDDKLFFAGQISDDYGFSKLEFVYYPLKNPNLKKKVKISLSSNQVQNFSYNFPNNLTLLKGISYEMYFRVVDNDHINNYKSITSERFQFRNKSDEEIKESVLEQQNKLVNNLDNLKQQRAKEKDKLNDFQNQFKEKKNVEWNDKKQIDEFLKRQEQYQSMMKKQGSDLLKNLKKDNNTSPTLQDKKNLLQERIKEATQTNKQKKLLEEINKLGDKINKENLLKNLQKISQQNKQQERSLEQILELTKRFYIEQKTQQIAEKLNQLSKEQERVSKDNNNAFHKQDSINKEFDNIKDIFNEVDELNKELKESMDLPDVENDKNKISKNLKESSESLQQNQKNQAKKNQKKASNNMKSLSNKLKQSMLQMEMKMIQENIEDIKKVVNNLMIFSFQQEVLIDEFSSLTIDNPNFSKQLQDQFKMKSYFEHIDDSLFVISTRSPVLSNVIQINISDVYSNLETALHHFSENRIPTGVANQNYVMTATNKLSDYLSNILDNVQNKMSGMNKSGEGSEGGLPNIIKKQQGLSSKMKEAMKPGKGKKGKNGSSDSEAYKFFQEQNQIRSLLQDMINTGNLPSNKAKQVLDSMEKLEQQLIEKGLSPQQLNNLQILDYQLLQLEKATLQQNRDNKRNSKTNVLEYDTYNQPLDLTKENRIQLELLNRQSLPLQNLYKSKITNYFKSTTIQRDSI